MKVTTNNQPRYMVAYADLPAEAQAWFDYIGEDDRASERFVCYRGIWRDVFEMPRLTDAPGWDAGEHDTAFSGVVVRIVDGGEKVVMGRYAQ